MMLKLKRLLIIIFLILIFSVGCSNTILADTTVKTITETTVTQTTVNNDYINLKVEYDRLAKDNAKLKADNEAYSYLLNNLNNLLKDVYYVYQKKSDGSSSWGTGFSIEHKDKFYLITAGHIVDSEYGVFKNLGFKANFTDSFIYPKLLSYENDVNYGNDYAIFYLDNINSGLKIGKVYGQNIVLGSTNNKLNVIRNVLDIPIEGESGSPVVNLNGEVIGILTGGLTNIDIVIKAIDNLK